MLTKLEDFGSRSGSKNKDFASDSPEPIDYGTVKATLWGNPISAVPEDDPRDALAEILSRHGVGLSNALLSDIIVWALSASEFEIIQRTSAAAEKLLEIFGHSRNRKLTLYAMKRVCGFPDVVDYSDQKKGDELGISQQAVNKAVDKMSKRFQVRCPRSHRDKQ